MHVGERSSVMDDQLNVPLEDAELLAEVELTTNLIIAASEAGATLTQQEVDEILGVEVPVGEHATIPAQQKRDPSA
jgi:hypothetical protein